MGRALMPFAVLAVGLLLFVVLGRQFGWLGFGVYLLLCAIWGLLRVWADLRGRR